MLISEWRGSALIIGKGGIGKAIATSIEEIAPELDVHLYGRDINPSDSFYIDLENDNSYGQFEQNIAALRKPLRFVFNTSGFLHSENIMPEKRLSSIKNENLLKHFAINSIAPILIAKSIEKFIRPNKPFNYASLSARVGSISDNKLGGWYSYRASKAAQNQLLKTLSIEWARKFPLAIVSVLHPGTCKTNLSAPFNSSVPNGKLFSPLQSAGYMLKVISDQKPLDTGSFLSWTGEEIPW